MNIRLVALMIAALALPTLAQAADLKGTNQQGGNPATRLQMEVRGESVISNNEQYRVLPGVRASQNQSNEKPQQTLSRADGGELVEIKGNFVVFTAVRQGVTSVTQSNGVTTYPTVINLRTGGVGIMPGTLSVKLKSIGNAAAVAKDHGLELVREFAHLQAVFYRVKPGQDVVAAAAALTADARVESAEVEVIEHMDSPN